MIQQLVLLTDPEAAALDRVAAAWGQERCFVIRAAIGRFLFTDGGTETAKAEAVELPKDVQEVLPI